jgi:lipid II:glycine glycyltransferase (peptidoglycan interpeptide bridge formation enzyme)
MIKPLKFNEINVEQWQNLVQVSPFSSYFQTKECYDFYCSLSFLSPFLFGVEENGKLSGVACGYIVADGNKIKRFFSRRAIILGGILLQENISGNALKTLLNFIVKNLKNKAIYIELRNYNNYSKYKKIFTENGFIYNEHLNFHIQTPNVETAMSKMSSTKRRDVKISQKNGAETVELISKNDLKIFYEILNNLYQTKIKTPFFPFDFFEKIEKLPGSKVFGIKFDGNIVGGSVCVLLKNHAVYEWFCCGLDEQFKNIYPSTLATWTGIEFAAQNGCKYFDMMGAGTPDKDYGVRDFKSKFGGKLVEFGRFLYLCNPLLYKFGKFYIQIQKIL